MDLLLLGADRAFQKRLRECLSGSPVPKLRIFSHSLRSDQLPENPRWDVVFFDGRVRNFPRLSDAVKKNQIEGLKVVLTDKEDLQENIDFWGPSIYTCLLKPVEAELLGLVWRNARERIQLSRKLSHSHNQRKKLRTLVQEHRDVEKDIFVSHLEIQELNQKKTSFLAQTAHELGTPLTALLGYLELLASQKAGPLGELQLQLLNRALGTCRRLSHLASSLMDLSALNGTKGQLRLMVDDIQECISETASELSQTIEKKGLALQVDTSPDIPRFRFDRDRMHQVFVNLLDNACKYSSSGDSIHVRCVPCFWERRSVPEAVDDSLERRKINGNGCFNSVRITVEDTGVGIASESMGGIFEEYTRETNSSGYHKGFGLGLAIARQIVLAHEGKIWAERNEGQGSIFTVLVPTSL